MQFFCSAVYLMFLIIILFWLGDNAGRLSSSIVARATTARPQGDAVYRPALGVPPADLDAGPVHLAAADHEDPLRAAGDGLTAALLQRHRLSQYWVRPFLSYTFILQFKEYR